MRQQKAVNETASRCKTFSGAKGTMHKIGEKEAEREKTLTESQMDKGLLSGPALSLEIQGEPLVGL